jgi:hypothetical protein
MLQEPGQTAVLPCTGIAGAQGRCKTAQASIREWKGVLNATLAQNLLDRSRAGCSRGHRCPRRRVRRRWRWRGRLLAGSASRLGRGPRSGSTGPLPFAGRFASARSTASSLRCCCRGTARRGPQPDGVRSVATARRSKVSRGGRPLFLSGTPGLPDRRRRGQGRGRELGDRGGPRVEDPTPTRADRSARACPNRAAHARVGRPATGACHPVATPNSMSERSSDRPAKVVSTATAILDPSQLGPVSGGA